MGMDPSKAPNKGEDGEWIGTAVIVALVCAALIVGALVYWSQSSTPGSSQGSAAVLGILACSGTSVYCAVAFCSLVSSGLSIR